MSSGLRKQGIKSWWENGKKKVKRENASAEPTFSLPRNSENISLNSGC